MALSAQEIREKLSKLISFLEPVSSLANSHFVSFFAEEVWRKHVPSEIQCELSSLESIRDFIEVYPEMIKNECPAGFAREHPNLVKFIRTASSISVREDESFSESLLQLESLFLRKGLFKKCKLKEEEFMSGKKLHEVEITSRVAAAVSEMTESSHLVDVGGGKGYLSCILALQYSFKVLGLDSSEATTCGALKRSAKVAKLWSREIPELREKAESKAEVTKRAKEEFMRKQYKQATTFVGPETDVEDLLEKGFSEEIGGITLTGLHTCGDLSPTCLRMFLASPKVRGLVNVGCCYNHVSEEFSEQRAEGKEARGFPMSSFLRKKRFGLGQNARMLGAHSLDRVGPQAESEWSQRSVFHRAVLEVVRREAGRTGGGAAVGRLGRRCRGFEEYMRAGLGRLGLAGRVTEEELKRLEEGYSGKRPYLRAFYLLRVTLAPVVESIILLDRVLYLLENGIGSAYLVPLFDLGISPRGFGIIAWKDLDKSKSSEFQMPTEEAEESREEKRKERIQFPS